MLNILIKMAEAEGDGPELPMPKEQCEVDVACLEAYGQMKYIPNLIGNAVFLGIFALAALGQLGLGIRHKTWGYMVAMLLGIVLEIAGYYGRIALHNDIFEKNNFIIYLVGLTIGPAFFSAAVYLSFGRIVTIFGHGLSWFSARTITLTFVSFDIVSLILQSLGGAIASMGDDQASTDRGVNIMIAGLAAQVLATTLFCGVVSQLWLAIRRHPERLDHSYASFRKTLKFRLFLWALGVSTISILIRCIFRCAELMGGFHSDLANNEKLFMLLDGIMMIIVVIALTVFHPGFTLGEYFHTATFSLRGNKKRNAAADKVAFLQNDSGSQIGLSTRYEPIRHQRLGSDV